MDNTMLGLKEIYGCVLKATYDIDIRGKKIKAGEPIAVFDSVQMADFQEIKSRIDATGGYNNQTWVSWESTKEVRLNFTQGVFSKIHFALLGNSDLTKANEVDVPENEDLEINEELQVTLKFTPKEGTLFVYDKSTGALLTDYELNDKVIHFNNIDPYTEIEVYYDFIYENVDMISIGRQLISGYLTMTAKTRLKDDVTGKTVTGVFKIPRLKLMSDFSIRLGNDVPPSVGHFGITAYPTGSKGSEKVIDFILLNDDIDSDI